jgi:hypothetical protein
VTCVTIIHLIFFLLGVVKCEVYYYAPFFVLFMNEKKGVEWEGTLSPCCAVLQTTRESKGVVNCEGTKQAGKL